MELEDFRHFLRLVAWPQVFKLPVHTCRHAHAPRSRREPSNPLPPAWASTELASRDPRKSRFVIEKWVPIKDLGQFIQANYTESRDGHNGAIPGAQNLQIQITNIKNS